MSRSINDVLQDIWDGIPGKRKKDVGPLGDAIVNLTAWVKFSLDKGLYHSTIIVRCAHVLLDHTKKSHEALEAARVLIGLWEDGCKDPKAFAMALDNWKAAAIAAKMHQYTPLNQIPKLEAALARPSIVKPGQSLPPEKGTA